MDLEGFRGAAVPVDLRLGEKSLCVLAENGHGKTTWVDGLEFWSSGDVRHYHREGYGLDCLVHVDAIVAKVSAEPTGLPPMSRTLSRDGGASDLKPAGPVPVGTTVAPLPILRHRTMSEFMDMTRGEKKAALLELLGLARLTDFRKSLKAACTVAERRANDAARRLKTETAALNALLDGADLVARAEEIRVEAGISNAVKNPDDLADLTIDVRPAAQVIDRLGQTNALAQAINTAKDDVTRAWNEAVGDSALTAAASLSALMKAGERTVQAWDEETCPLCRQPKDRNELLDEIRFRAAELHEIEMRFQELAASIDAYVGRLESLATALDALISRPPSGGWPDQAKLAEASETIRTHLKQVRAARNERRPIPPRPELDIPSVAKLESAASADAESAKPVQALGKLVQLREQFQRQRDAQRDDASSAAVAQTMTAFLGSVDARIRQEIEQAISRIGHVAADYYGRLVANPVYSDVKLEYTPGRSGGVEFSMLFDGRHKVSPPQRVMSESQLNALGLALFLARLKVDTEEWETLVLDDVVNSFDAAHRVGLARLLADEFVDWQVFLVTHDRVFASLARKILRGWRFMSIAAWTPTGGPVFVDGNVREQLRARLAEGRSASELGGIARVALEQGLALPLEKLGLEIRYDPLGRYTAHDYLVGLRRGLKDRKSSLATLPVLARMEADSYLVNIGAHDRPADPALTADDLRRLVEDLTELEASFICSACGEPAWAASLDAGRHHQCRCSALAV